MVKSVLFFFLPFCNFKQFWTWGQKDEIFQYPTLGGWSSSTSCGVQTLVVTGNDSRPHTG